MVEEAMIDVSGMQTGARVGGVIFGERRRDGGCEGDGGLEGKVGSEWYNIEIGI